MQAHDKIDNTPDGYNYPKDAYGSSYCYPVNHSFFSI